MGIKGGNLSNIFNSFTLIDGLEYLLVLDKDLSLMLDGVLNTLLLTK